jgi:acyl-CoA hydrolase
MSIQHLLEIIDLQLIVFAERHAHVNCGTASMSDAIIEKLPRVGHMIRVGCTTILFGGEVMAWLTKAALAVDVLTLCWLFGQYFRPILLLVLQQ